MDFQPENSDYFIVEEQSINLQDSKYSDKSSEVRSNFKGNEEARKYIKLIYSFNFVIYFFQKKGFSSIF